MGKWAIAENEWRKLRDRAPFGKREREQREKRAKKKEKPQLSLTSGPRRRRAPSRSRSTRARSLSLASGRSQRTRTENPGNSRALWSSEGRGAASARPRTSRASSTHQQSPTLTASARCSWVSEGLLFHGRGQSRLSVRDSPWDFGIEGRGGWLSGRSRRACQLSSRFRRDGEKKVQAGQEEACSLVREGKRKKKRGAVKNERVSPSCFTLSFSSSFPTLSNPPLSPAMGIKVRLVSLRWSDGRLECVFA